MQVGDYIALFGALFTAITAIPVLGALFPLGSRHDRKIVSFAQEVLASPCDDHQRNYWTNARNQALSAIEARQAFPERSKTKGFLFIVVGMLFSVNSGLFSLPAITNILATVVALILLIVAFSMMELGAYLIRRIEAERENILITRVSERNIGFSLRLGLVASSYLIGLITAVQGIVLEPGTPQLFWYVLLIIISIAAGPVVLLITGLIRFAGTAWEDRADAHLLTPYQHTVYPSITVIRSPRPRRAFEGEA